MARQLLEVVSGDIVNMYGPTETTIWSTSFRLGDFTTNVPIGRPLSNTYVRILDSALQPTVPGEPGELFIGGEGVVRGYWDRPELTAERFLRDPLGGTGRLYRTGDLACFRPDGELEFLGRVDFQVKIRGFRIELGEIEAALERLPEVSQAVVVAREERPGDQRLAAYVVARPGHTPAGPALRASLAQALPEQMVPSVYHFVDAMPLTANGKIDRNALLAPVVPAPVADHSAPPPGLAGGLEKTISELWADALGIECVGVDENFFDLGAHSLLIAEVHARLRECLARELSLMELFRFPTVRALSSHLSGPPVPEENRSGASSR
ncbi:MAG: non-ribosomal peptide synthetase, partial [Bryobacteraceae bacterium]